MRHSMDCALAEQAVKNAASTASTVVMGVLQSPFDVHRRESRESVPQSRANRAPANPREVPEFNTKAARSQWPL